MEENSNSYDNLQTDTADALGFSFGSSNKPKHIVKSSVGKDDYFYNMNHKKRGLAIIFNHQTFIVPNLKDRNGTNVDSEQLKMCFKKLDFDVHSYNDLGVKALLETVEKVSAEDHSDYDCLVVAILTHGEEGLLFARDSAYKHEQVFDNFRGDKCPSLVGKPKIFFIQACQGSRLDGGVSLVTEKDSSVCYYKIPIYADFLIVYSTIPGFYSWRNTTNGSWFIQALAAELRESGTMYDLLTILTFVSRRVAVDFESRVPDNSSMDKQKQIPCVTSMLTRLIKFSPKSDNKNNSFEKVQQKSKEVNNI
uniref:Putative caspase n=1 Tax=Rhodnius neglectus TaxID=72488 RepID=A0A0P4VSE4_9HEMI